MKKKTLLLSALVLSAAAATAQTQLPNSSFEDMTPITVDRSTYAPPASTINYDSLHNGWVSGNEIFKDGLFGGATDELFAQDTSDASDGSHALLMRSHTTSGTSVFATGNTGLGIFVFNASNPFNSVKQGMPFADRPVNFEFDYKYLNNAGDSCQAVAVLTKWNAAQMKRDTIGIANWVSTSETTTWTTESVAFTYLSSETPDTANVLFLSSKGGLVESFAETPVGQPGATFIVDNLNMDYTSGINNESIEIATVNTLNNVINVNLNESALIEVIALNGAVIYSSKENKGLTSIAAKQGLYVVNIRNNETSMTKKVVLK